MAKDIIAGDKIRLPWVYPDGQKSGKHKDFTVEEFRYCLGIFVNENDRTAGKFTPLCELYRAGPESEERYIGNYGTYYTNQVPDFIKIED